MALSLSNDFRKIILQDIPLIDVRAPLEYKKGSFPNAVNLPLMSDKEREEVGITYKQKGNEAAVKLGNELVCGKIKESRVEAWCDFLDANPKAMLYCFRGGQRSGISQQWIHEAKREIVRLKGGYKAFRNFLMSETEASVEKFHPIVIGGRTGSGKTELLKKFDNMIDLEGLANHRGSSFGRHLTPQPSQIDFENALAYALIQKLNEGHSMLVFEDEGTNVGRVYIPFDLSNYISKGDLIILRTDIKERVRTTFDEYVNSMQKEFKKVYTPQEAFKKWHESMQNSLDRIKRRLGSQRHMEISVLLGDACLHQERTEDASLHKIWVKKLLCEYYDPMYDYQIKKRKNQVVFEGDDREVEEYIKNRPI